MIAFFYTDRTVKAVKQEIDFKYEHVFEAAPSTTEGMSANHIYFTTPSDFFHHRENIKQQTKEDVFNVLLPEPLAQHPQFPEHIGFKNLTEVLPKYRNLKTFRLALINAMSSAIGDHLIGMRAFDYFYDQLQALLPGVELDISLFQLNPYRVGDITKQYEGKFKHIYMLPNRLARLMSHNAFIDLGTLILRENFGTQPMIDFFFEALSIDPTTVPPEKKRSSFSLDRQALDRTAAIFNNIRLQGRPILLFHHTSTTTIRQMTEPRARAFVNEILDNSDYFVVSADWLEFSHKRFRNLSSHSKGSVNNFAAIISQVDAVITVDTLTYHLADAFNIPTVVLFTTIEPEHRIKYYPHTKAIQLVREGEPLYGRHKGGQNPEQSKQDIAYLEEKWANLKAIDALRMLS